MKNLLFLFAFSFLLLNLQAQQAVNVTYLRTPNIENQLRGQNDPKIRERVTATLQKMKDPFVLLASATQSVYLSAASVNAEDAIRQLENGDQLNMNGEKYIYKSVTDNLYEENKTILGQSFFIYDQLPHFDWEITRETTTIAGYSCVKATTVFNGEAVAAWFTYELPIAGGPEYYGGLPGLILELHSYKHSYYVEKIGQASADAIAKITPPEKEGKQVTLAEYLNTEKELKSSMRQNAMNGGGAVIGY